MMPTSLFIAFRYLFKINQEKSLSVMFKICFLCITITTLILALIISILNGFETATLEKLQNIHSPIIMQAKDKLLNFEQISKALKKEFYNEINHFSPNDLQYVMVNIENNYDINNIVYIKGIDPNNESKINNFIKKITLTINNKKNLQELIKKNEVLIGHKLSKNLFLNIGDEINIFSPTDFTENNTVKFKKDKAIVIGLFNTGIDEFDSKFIVCSLSFLKEIFPNSGITQIGISLKNNSDEKKVIEKLQNRFKIDIFSWKDLYPTLVSALKLEKIVISIVLLMIILIASINVISLMFMIIEHKKKDIAIYKSFGFNNFQIQKVFTSLGLIITIFATFLGLILAFIFGKIIEHYNFIELPDVYFVTSLPIKIELLTFCYIFFSVLILSFLAIIIPIKKITSINISDLIKI